MTIASVINKAEIQLYSTLISVMSGINQLKAGDTKTANYGALEIPKVDTALYPASHELTAKPISKIWESIQQVLLSLLLWIILGFAAGFLIGMINAG